MLIVMFKQNVCVCEGGGIDNFSQHTSANRTCVKVPHLARELQFAHPCIISNNFLYVHTTKLRECLCFHKYPIRICFQISHKKFEFKIYEYFCLGEN